MCVCVFSLTRLTLVLLVLHYTVEMIFHTSRLLYFSEKAEVANYGYLFMSCFCFIMFTNYCTLMPVVKVVEMILI